MNIPMDAGETDTAEKRRYKRIRVHQPVQLHPKDSALGRGSLSCDLSEGGACVDMYDFVPLGAELTLQIRLAAEKVVEHIGRVVWIRKLLFADRYQAGLEFSRDNTFLASKRQLHEFIEVQ